MQNKFHSVGASLIYSLAQTPRACWTFSGMAAGRFPAHHPIRYLQKWNPGRYVGSELCPGSPVLPHLHSDGTLKPPTRPFLLSSSFGFTRQGFYVLHLYLGWIFSSRTQYIFSGPYLTVSQVFQPTGWNIFLPTSLHQQKDKYVPQWFSLVQSYWSRRNFSSSIRAYKSSSSAVTQNFHHTPVSMGFLVFCSSKRHIIERLRLLQRRISVVDIVGWKQNL